MKMKFENEHQAKCNSSVEGAACKGTPDTALRQIADEHFKARFRTFEIGSKNRYFCVPSALFADFMTDASLISVA